MVYQIIVLYILLHIWESSLNKENLMVFAFLMSIHAILFLEKTKS